MDAPLHSCSYRRDPAMPTSDIKGPAPVIANAVRGDDRFWLHILNISKSSTYRRVCREAEYEVRVLKLKKFRV